MGLAGMLQTLPRQDSGQAVMAGLEEREQFGEESRAPRKMWGRGSRGGGRFAGAPGAEPASTTPAQACLGGAWGWNSPSPCGITPTFIRQSWWHCNPFIPCSPPGLAAAVSGATCMVSRCWSDGWRNREVGPVEGGGCRVVATAVCIGACESIDLRLASSVRMAECTLQGEETRMAGGHMGLRQWGWGEWVEG